MEGAFIIIAGVTLLSAVGAMSFRKPVHCALCAAVSFIGLAATFLLLEAEFVAFAQVLIYVGAIAILVVFAILLTRNEDAGTERLFFQPWTIGVGVALLVAAVLISAAHVAGGGSPTPAAEHGVTVRVVGEALMTRYVMALEVMALLLTAAMIGAVLIAMKDGEEKR